MIKTGGTLEFEGVRTTGQGFEHDPVAVGNRHAGPLAAEYAVGINRGEGKNWPLHPTKMMQARSQLRESKGGVQLSKREVEILRCVCRGLTNKEIAEIKFISEYTVKDHVKKIMRNMAVSSRSEILPALLE